jgi:ureidoacrylate peracid hydrolase
MYPSLDTDFASRLDASSSTVVVIDAQNDFCHPEGVQAKMGKDVSRLVETLARLDAFLGHSRRNGVPIIFVQNTSSDRTDTPAWSQRHAHPDRPKVCREGTWGADFYGGGPQAEDIVVRKHRYSAFVGPELEVALERIGRRSLIFTGFATSICVESSLREAVCRDYVATIVADCCGDYSERAHERALEAVANGFGLVATSTEVIGHWTNEMTSPAAQVVAQST